jgi:hypothetical protein
MKLVNLYNTQYSEFIEFEDELYFLLTNSWNWRTSLNKIFCHSTYKHYTGLINISKQDLKLINKEESSYSRKLQNIYIDLLINK